MTRLLIAAFSHESRLYMERAQRRGMQVEILDCFESTHHQLTQWYGEAVLHVQGRRTDVRDAVSDRRYDVAVVQDEANFVRTALITQSLREAGVPLIIVVTDNASKRGMYRRLGAHRVVVASTEEEAWTVIDRMIPQFATA